MEPTIIYLNDLIADLGINNGKASRYVAKYFPSYIYDEQYETKRGVLRIRSVVFFDKVAELKARLAFAFNVESFIATLLSNQAKAEKFAVVQSAFHALVDAI